MLFFSDGYAIICRCTYISEDKNMIISFFGHADFPKTVEHQQSLIAVLERIIGDAPADIYLGGYGSFDSLAYDCSKKYHETHPRISLFYVTPYMTVEYQRTHLAYQKEKYDGIICPPIEDKPPRFAISYRNQWMVEQSDYIICGIFHPWGGAYKAYCYAQRKKKPIINITETKFNKPPSP